MFNKSFCRKFLSDLIGPLLFFGCLVFFVKNSGLELSLLGSSPLLGSLVIFSLSILLFCLWRFLPFLGPFVGKELPVISLAGVFIYFSWMGIEKKELGLAFSIFFVGWILCWGGWQWFSSLEEKICSKHE